MNGREIEDDVLFVHATQLEFSGFQEPEAIPHGPLRACEGFDIQLDRRPATFDPTRQDFGIVKRCCGERVHPLILPGVKPRRY
jgi:hypothetical protein